jgi:putative transposase
VSKDVIDLIHKMSLVNPRWGAARIHGELLKLGFKLAESTVAKYMVRPRKPPSQTWRTFLTNHATTLVSSDFFVVPTVFFRVLFVFVIISHDRRRPVHVAVTEYPTAE